MHCLPCRKSQSQVQGLVHLTGSGQVVETKPLERPHSICLRVHACVYTRMELVITDNRLNQLWKPLQLFAALM